MAKLCSSFGSSPNFSFLSDEIYGADLAQINPELGLSNSDLGIIGPDPAELFDDVNLLNIWPTSSIYGDIKRIQADSPTICDSFMESCALTDLKPEIRNMDCMWSASTSLLGSSASSSLSDTVNGANAVPLSAITGSNTQNINNNNNNNNNNSSNNVTNKINTNGRLSPPPPTVVVVANNNKRNNSNSSISSSSSHSNGSQFDTILLKQEIKEEPLDDYEQQLQQHSIPTATKQYAKSQTSTDDTFTTNTMQHIPPGTSLLRKSQVQQQQQQYKLKLKQQQSPTNNNFIRERDQLLTSVNNKHNNNNNRVKLQVYANGVGSSSSSLQNMHNFGRPDTPHSLDDNNNNNNNNNSHEFKHTLDLHACVVGSNNISLTSDPNKFIHHVSQELQDTSKTQIDLRYVTSGCSTLAEVAEVLEGIDGEKCSLGGTTASSSGVDCDSDSAGEDEDAWNVGESTRCSMDSMLDAAEEANTISGYGINNLAASPVPSQDSLMSGSSGSYHHNYSSNSSKQQPPYITHSDHSYTRCKDGVDDLRPSIETPSDSDSPVDDDEEIDVVSLGDKKLPTNPSDKDRRVLQTKVAYKFSNARVVKTPSGLRTIPPRRVSYELPYTPASSSPVKSVANSRYPSPIGTPAHVAQQQYTSRFVQQQQQQQQQQQNRKRLNLPSAGAFNVEMVNNDYASPPYKRQRGKKCMSMTSVNGKVVLTAPTSPNETFKRANSSANSTMGDEATDTIEKRNLHNDMERQRRIGLKNLFESLKKQIPSIRDKERAPKVNILREAAKLCESLTREDQLLNEQKALLKEQTRRHKEELVRLRASMPAHVLQSLQRN